MFKTEMEVVTGFLGSGKTYFINTLLQSSLSSKETVLIIQCETGEQNITFNRKGKIILKEYDPSKDLTYSYLKQMINFYNPHRVIIEHNGMKPLTNLLTIIGEDLSEFCMEPAIYHITDALTFDMLFNNMKEIIEPYIYHSNVIVINNLSLVSKENKKALKNKIKALNRNAFILSLGDISELNYKLNSADILSDGIFKMFRITLKDLTLKNFIRRR